MTAIWNVAFVHHIIPDCTKRHIITIITIITEQVDCQLEDHFMVPLGHYTTSISHATALHA